MIFAIALSLSAPALVGGSISSEQVAESFFAALRKADQAAIAKTLAPKVELTMEGDTAPDPHPKTRELLAIILVTFREINHFEWVSSSCNSPTAAITTCDITSKLKPNGRLAHMRWSVVVADGLVQKVSFSDYEMVTG